MFAGIVRQLCQPPVLAMAKLPIDGPVRLSSRTLTSPLTPPAAPDATRALNVLRSVLPKLTLSNRRWSPLAIQATFCPPSVSEVVSFATPAMPDAGLRLDPGRGVDARRPRGRW